MLHFRESDCTFHERVNATKAHTSIWYNKKKNRVSSAKKVEKHSEMLSYLTYEYNSNHDIRSIRGGTEGPLRIQPHNFSTFSDRGKKNALVRQIF